MLRYTSIRDFVFVCFVKSSFSEITCKTNNPDEQVRTDPYGMTLGRGVEGRRAGCGARRGHSVGCWTVRGLTLRVILYTVTEGTRAK